MGRLAADLPTYSYHGTYLFRDAEIDQLVALVTRSNHGDTERAINGCYFSRQVKQWALHWSLLVERKQESSVRLFLSTAADGCVFDSACLPVEAIWRLVKLTLASDKPGMSSGYSAARHAAWLNLGIAPVGHKWADERDLRAQEALLGRLAMHHYIDFQQAGTTWVITPRPIEERITYDGLRPVDL